MCVVNVYAEWEQERDLGAISEDDNCSVVILS